MNQMIIIPISRHEVSDGWKSALEYIVIEVQNLMIKEYKYPLSFELTV